MSDTITQKLGFDASDAISTIARLNAAMQAMGTQVQSLGQSLSAFNSAAASQGKSLDSLATSASKAAQAFERLAKAKGAGVGGGGRGGSGGGGGKRGAIDDAEQQLAIANQIAALQKRYGAAAAGSSVESQRGFQSAITSAATFAVKTKQSIEEVEKASNNLGGTYIGGANTLADRLKRVQTAFAATAKSADAGQKVISSAAAKQEQSVLARSHIEALQKHFGAAPANASIGAQRRFQSAITGVAEFAAKTKQTVSEVQNIANNLGGSFTGPADTVANKLASITQAFEKMQKSASQNTNKLTIDFQTFVRIVSTQVVVRALSSIKQAFGEAFDSAMKFQTQVAEIGTISTKDFGGASGITKVVRDISDSFNLPLSTTAEGYYETISNQIGDAAKSQEFLGSAAKLAKAGVTGLDQSVNLLSAAINAYGMSTSQSDALASKFFETVRLGRVRVDDLANTLGRVAPQAKQLGVSVDEMLATIAAITISGVKPAEALTQFRGGLNALAKPTDELKAAFHELNIESAEQGVALYGYGGLLQKLATQTDGTSQAFAKLFPNMRGVNGAIIVGKAQIAQYGEAMKTIKGTSGQLINDKAGEIMSSDAQKVGAQIQRLKNTLTNDLGGSLISVAATMGEFGLGLDTMTKGVTLVTPAILGAAAALGVYAAQLGLAKVTGMQMAAGLGSIQKGLLLLGTGYAIASGLNKALDYAKDKPHTDLTAAQKENTEAFKRAQEKEVAAAEEKFDRIARAARNNLRVANQIYQENVRNAQKANDDEFTNLKDNLQRMLSAREKLVTKLRQVEGDSVQAIQQSQGRSANMSLDREKAVFEARMKGLDLRQHAFALRDRTSDLTSRASNMLSSAAGDPQKMQMALRLFQEAGSAAQEFQSKAGESSFMQRTAQEAVLRVYDKQIQAEKQLEQMEAQRQKRAEALRKEQEKKIGDMKGYIKTILENSGEFDENNKRFSAQQLEDRAKKRNSALSKLTKSGITDKDFSLAQSLGLAKFVAQYKSELSDAGPIKLRFDIEDAHRQIQQMFDESIGALDKAVPARKLLEKASGKPITNVSEAQMAVEEIAKLANDLRHTMSEARGRQRQITESRQHNEIDLKELDKIPNSGLWKTLISKDILGAIPGVAELARKANPTEAEFEAAKLKYKGALGSSSLPLGENRFISTPQNTAALGLLGNVLDRVRHQMDLREGGKGNSAFADMQGAASKLQGYEQAVSAARSTLLGMPAPIREASQGLGEVGSAAMTAAEKLNSIPMPQQAVSGGEAAEGHSTGGLIYQHFANGGQPRGVDNVPAMLAPNEFVMNARSTRKFYTQLAAMNAGIQPNFRQNTGSVTNVGDVTVHVNGATAPQSTARAVATELRRLQRRGVTR